MEQQPFKKYKRIENAEMRPVTKKECYYLAEQFAELCNVSVSTEDARAGSPQVGDMIARNPKNHKDQWLVAGQYFKDNFREINE